MTGMLNHKVFIWLIASIIMLIGVGGSAAPASADTPAANAQSIYDYQPLAPLPDYAGIGDSTVKTDNLTQYILNLYIIFISLSGVLAVFMITYGGIKLMTTDAFEKKNEGKDIIKHAVWGLLLVMGSYLILYTIDPKIFNLEVQFMKNTNNLNTGPIGPTPTTGNVPSAPSQSTSTKPVQQQTKTYVMQYTILRKTSREVYKVEPPKSFSSLEECAAYKAQVLSWSNQNFTYVISKDCQEQSKYD